MTEHDLTATWSELQSRIKELETRLAELQKTANQWFTVNTELGNMALQRGMRIKELEEQNKILRDALDDCLSWMQADHEWSECRNDEDCDHCLGLQIIESTKQALVRVSSSKTLFEKVSEGGEV